MADVLLAAADTPAGLRRALREPSYRGGAGPCRIAVLDPAPDRLARAEAVIDRGEPWRGDELWFVPGPGPSGRIAFLFPGLDGRTGPTPDDVASWFGLPPRPPGGDGTLGGRTRDALWLNRTLDLALRAVRIVPDAVAGHSAGEWSALFAAGAFQQGAFERFAADIGTGAVPDVVFAAVGLPADRAAALTATEPGVVLSHDNAPEQCVLCGEQDAVLRCLERIEDPAVPRRVLPFRSGFHTPMLAPYLPGFTAAFDRVPLAARSVPVWSATTLAPYPESEVELRALLETHLLRPVRFRELLLALHDSGVRTFVQAGCGSLTRFAAATLAERPHAVLSAGSATRPQLDQLRWAAAALWAEGRDPDLGALGLARPGRGGAPVLAAYQAATATVSASIDLVYRSWRQR